MDISCVRGAEARALLEDATFVAEWSRLCQECPWATAFQGPGFCCAWYRSYRPRYDPFLLVSRAKAGSLLGLLPLAVSLKDGCLAIAGAWQAEYHAWVCAPDLGDVFPWQAVQALRRAIPQGVLTFQYLPPATPTNWLAAREAKWMCALESHRRPLLQFGDGEEIAHSLKKKSNKSRLTRLQKMGPLQFKRITDPKEFEEVLDQVVPCYDFRQAAAYGVAPFANDDLKRPFHLAMMKVRGLLHTTVLKVGDHFASAHLGACGSKEVQLGIIAHNPFLAKHSPGKFHVLFLAHMLMKEGYDQLDLTPGGNPFKDRFATAFDEVHALTVFPSPWQRTKEIIRTGAIEAVKKGLRIVRVEPKRLKSLGGKLKRIHPVRTPASLIQRGREWIGRRREMRIYSYGAASVPDLAGPALIRRDAMDDLLSYQPAESWQSRDQFLSTSLHRIEDGLHVYTYAENGHLLHYGWLIERQEKSFVSEVRQKFTFPPNSACMFDFYTFPQARGRGLYKLSLRTMLLDAARVSGTEKVYIAVSADNRSGRHVIEMVGFRYECSLFEEVRFGRARRWARMTETGDANLSSRPLK